MKRTTSLDSNQRNRISLPDYDDEEEDLLGEEQYMNEKVILHSSSNCLKGTHAFYQVYYYEENNWATLMSSSDKQGKLC